MSPAAVDSLPETGLAARAARGDVMRTRSSSDSTTRHACASPRECYDDADAEDAVQNENDRITGSAIASLGGDWLARTRCR